jgi:hypothetical protein
MIIDNISSTIDNAIEILNINQEVIIKIDDDYKIQIIDPRTVKVIKDKTK